MATCWLIEPQTITLPLLAAILTYVESEQDVYYALPDIKITKLESIAKFVQSICASNRLKDNWYIEHTCRDFDFIYIGAADIDTKVISVGRDISTHDFIQNPVQSVRDSRQRAIQALAQEPTKYGVYYQDHFVGYILEEFVDEDIRLDKLVKATVPQQAESYQEVELEVSGSSLADFRKQKAMALFVYQGLQYALIPSFGNFCYIAQFNNREFQPIGQDAKPFTVDNQLEEASQLQSPDNNPLLTLPYEDILYSAATLQEFIETVADVKRNLRRSKSAQKTQEFVETSMMFMKSEISLRDTWDELQLQFKELPFCKNLIRVYKSEYDVSQVMLIRSAQFQSLLAFETLRTLVTIGKDLTISEHLYEGHDDAQTFLRFHIEEMFGMVSLHYSCQFNFEDPKPGEVTLEQLLLTAEQDYKSLVLENGRYTGSILKGVIESLRTKYQTDFFSPMKTQDLRKRQKHVAAVRKLDLIQEEVASQRIASSVVSVSSRKYSLPTIKMTKASVKTQTAAKEDQNQQPEAPRFQARGFYDKASQPKLKRRFDAVLVPASTIKKTRQSMNIVVEETPMKPALITKKSPRSVQPPGSVRKSASKLFAQTPQKKQ